MTIDETHVGSVADLLDQYVTCRALGHSWDEDPSREYATIFSWTGAFRCISCTTQKIEAYSNVGDVIYRRYDYPPRYRVTRNRQGDRVLRSAMRAELMRRRVMLRRNSGAKPKLTGGRKVAL